MGAREEIVAANYRYTSAFSKGGLPMPPARRFAVLTCMDARIDPAKVFGLDEGDAHVIRNAGGLAADDAIRSLIISHQLLGTEEVFVAAHTDCGMLTFTNDECHALLRDRSGADASAIDFLPFPDLARSVHESVTKIRQSPFLQGIPVSGWIYDVHTGRLGEVSA